VAQLFSLACMSAPLIIARFLRPVTLTVRVNRAPPFMPAIAVSISASTLMTVMPCLFSSSSAAPISVPTEFII